LRLVIDAAIDDVLIVERSVQSRKLLKLRWIGGAGVPGSRQESAVRRSPAAAKKAPARAGAG
jgi:hypothetical protein